MMRYPLLAAAAIAVLATPAGATLQIGVNVAGTPFFCADQDSCDTNGAEGTLAISNQAINGVQVNGSIQTSTKGPTANILNTSSLSLINGTALAKEITFTVGDTDFVGPVAQFFTAGSGTWQTANGSNITIKWYNDPANSQGADQAGDTPGTLIDMVADTAVGPADAFSHSGSGATSDAGLFSMTESITGLLTAGGQLVNHGTTEIKPIVLAEPGAMGILLVGLTGMWVARRRRWI